MPSRSWVPFEPSRLFGVHNQDNAYARTAFLLSSWVLHVPGTPGSKSRPRAQGECANGNDDLAGIGDELEGAAAGVIINARHDNNSRTQEEKGQRLCMSVASIKA